MDKVDIVREVSYRTEYRQTDIEEVFEAIMQTAMEALLRGEEVYFTPLGRFRVKTRPLRKRFVPNIQTCCYSKPKYAVHFLPSRDLRVGLIDKYAEEFPEEMAKAGMECDP